MASRKPYKRLPGTGYRRTVPVWLILMSVFSLGVLALLLRGRRVQLWEGEEELLLVESNGYTEKYKRFNYANIQGFIIRKTQSARIANFILVAIVVVFAAVAISVSDMGGRIALMIIGSIFLLLAVVNALMGSSCQTFIRTAVQTDELPSLDRLPRAKKVIKRLKPRIAAAQGELAVEEIPARIRELLPRNAPPLTAVVTEPSAPPIAPDAVGVSAATAGEAPAAPPILQ